MPRLPKTVQNLFSVAAASCWFLLTQPELHADPISFPSGLIPLTSIEYASAPDANGIRLILGYSTFPAFAVIRSLPSPSDGQMFLDSSIELAPAQFFRNVFVPTDAERFGDFRDFGGPILDPYSSIPFPDNIIPTSVLGGIYAFRIGPADTAVPEPRPLYTFATGAMAVVLARCALRLKVARVH